MSTTKSLEEKSQAITILRNQFNSTSLEDTLGNLECLAGGCGVTKTYQDDTTQNFYYQWDTEGAITPPNCKACKPNQTTSGNNAPTNQPTNGNNAPTNQPTSGNNAPTNQPTNGTTVVLNDDSAPTNQPTSGRTSVNIKGVIVETMTDSNGNLTYKLHFPKKFSQTQIDEITENINMLFNSENIENEVTQEAITTTTYSPNLSQSTPAPILNFDIDKKYNSVKINDIFEELTVKDIKILLSKLMKMNLDLERNSNLFNLIAGGRDSLKQRQQYDSDHDMGKDIGNHSNENMSDNLSNSLKRYDPVLWNIFFGKGRSHNYSELYVPGYQFSKPANWPSQAYKPPSCLVDPDQKAGPYAFYAQGSPDSLSVEGLPKLA